MTKYIFLLAVLSLALLPAPARSAEGGIAAIVNDSIVTVTDVRERVHLYTSGQGQTPGPEQLKQLEAQVLDKLIDEALELQQAKKLGIAVNEAMVQTGFEHISKQNNLTPDAFREKLKQSGASIDSLYDQIRADIAWDSVVRRELRPRVNVSEREIDMTLERIKQDDGKKQYRVAEIFLPVPDPARENDTRAAAENLVTQIRGGAPFSAAARQFSQAPGAGAGGDLGWVEEGQLDPALDKALQALHTGQISDPIRTDKGYHIVFLRDVRTLSATPPAAAKSTGPLVTLQQLFIPLQKNDSEAVVKAKLARGLALKKEIKSCDDMDKRMNEFRNPGTRALGKGPQDQLSPPLRAVVEKLAVNELSQPLRGDDGIALIMVCAREEQPQAPAAASPGAPDDESARENIAGTLGTQRLDKMAERYLRDLRAAAVIDKRL